MMEEREARFLMRQRGAGMRNVDDFSFTVGAGSDSMSTSDDGSRSNALLDNNTVRNSDLEIRPDVQLDTRVNDNAGREQRLLMRKRGAGTREKNIDFSLHLGAPTTSSPTTRVSEVGSVSSVSPSQSARTGAQRQGFVAAPSPLRQNARQSLARTTDVDADGSATKRRRLSPPIEQETADVEAEEDAQFLDDDGIQAVSEEDVPAETIISTDSPQASSNGSARRRRKKKSVLRKPKKRKTANTASSVASSTITEEDETSELEETTQTNRLALAETGHAQQPSLPSSRLGDDDAAAEESVVQLNAGSTNDYQATASSEQSRLYSIFDRSDRPPTIPSNPAVQRILTQHGVSNKENRPLQVRSKPAATTTARSSKSASKETTTRKRGKRQTKQQKSSTHGLVEQNNEVAITVRRVANISHLDFLSTKDDELQAEQVPALRQKRAPNGIDVLAQICREIIDKRVKAISTTQDTNTRNGGLKRQTETIRRFSDELDSRLLLMTTALDHSISLTHSLKEASRQKALHRSTLLELRQRRHEIELQQDSIRAANEAQTTLSSERFELNTLLSDIQLAVQRGKEDSHDTSDALRPERESISARIQQVSEVVSSADGRQGILQRVQAMNALLERFLTPSSPAST